MVLDRQRQALYEEREKLYEEYRYLKKEYADLDKASQTIDDYLEDLRNEPEHKRKKGELEQPCKLEFDALLMLLNPINSILYKFDKWFTGQILSSVCRNDTADFSLAIGVNPYSRLNAVL